MAKNKYKAPDEEQVEIKGVKNEEPKKEEPEKTIPKKEEPKGIKVKVTGFASLTYKGKKYLRGEVVYLDEPHFKKWERWVKKVK